MNLTAAIGALSIGAVIGWLVRYFIRRFHSFTPKSLSAVTSALLGGAAVRLFADDSNIWWMYCIGVAVGFLVIYPLIAFFAIRYSDGETSFSEHHGDDAPAHSSGRFDGVLFGRKGLPGENDKQL